jgi:hypothetical protein
LRHESAYRLFRTDTLWGLSDQQKERRPPV